jgi:hypothetical protein
MVQDMWSDRGVRAGDGPSRGQEAQVTGFTKAAIGLGVVGLILMIFNFWLGVIVIAAGIAIPVGAYFMLDPSQRRRLRELRRRKQIGR